MPETISATVRVDEGRKHVQRNEYAWEYVSVFHWNPPVFECGLTFGFIFLKMQGKPLAEI
jgi:hypothetical protein